MGRDVVIYSTSWCGPCKMAKRLLDDKGFKYKEIDIESENISREDLYNITGGRTVPQIVIDNSSIGGYDDLLEMDREGKL